ncbi:sugar transporter, putative [Plasmodium ovale curtisi]|uniref:Sugar transporter, putative n=1 Tax=Plasmodium ovale curtisi TaxID=864141 RepID=A0A1A8WM96_PLAOA|nr:sugar transporter, putative [Plasmodium ovale curtisi]
MAEVKRNKKNEHEYEEINKCSGRRKGVKGRTNKDRLNYVENSCKDSKEKMKIFVNNSREEKKKKGDDNIRSISGNCSLPKGINHETFLKKKKIANDSNVCYSPFSLKNEKCTLNFPNFERVYRNKNHNTNVGGKDMSEEGAWVRESSPKIVDIVYEGNFLDNTASLGSVSGGCARHESVSTYRHHVSDVREGGSNAIWSVSKEINNNFHSLHAGKGGSENDYHSIRTNEDNVMSSPHSTNDKNHCNDAKCTRTVNEHHLPAQLRGNMVKAKSGILKKSTVIHGRAKNRSHSNGNCNSDTNYTGDANDNGYGYIGYEDVSTNENDSIVKKYDINSGSTYFNTDSVNHDLYLPATPNGYLNHYVHASNAPDKRNKNVTYVMNYDINKRDLPYNVMVCNQSQTETEQTNSNTNSSRDVYRINTLANNSKEIAFYDIGKSYEHLENAYNNNNLLKYATSTNADKEKDINRVIQNRDGKIYTTVRDTIRKDIPPKSDIKVKNTKLSECSTVLCKSVEGQYLHKSMHKNCVIKNTGRIELYPHPEIMEKERGKGNIVRILTHAKNKHGRGYSSGYDDKSTESRVTDKMHSQQSEEKYNVRNVDKLNSFLLRDVHGCVEGSNGIRDERVGIAVYGHNRIDRKPVYIQQGGGEDGGKKKKKKKIMNYYEKRGSFTYSGLLTSMVSSILTQQNERKMKESNCLNHGWKNDEYNYTLLHQFSERDKNKRDNVHKDVYTGCSTEHDMISYGSEYGNAYIFSHKVMEGLNQKTSSESVLLLTLTLMICLSVLCNYDHGAIPVTLEEIQKDFPLSYIEQSLLGSLVYFGLIIGTIIASVLFELLSAKLLVTISILLLSISLYIFSHANCITFMYISRFVNGLCQAIPVVYLPVWVDEFSPQEKATQWMSYIQLASIGGTVFGYFLGGILSNNYSCNKNDSPFLNVSLFTTWRSPFLIQAFLLLPLFLIMIFIPSDMINISSTGTNEDSSTDGSYVEGGYEGIGSCKREGAERYLETCNESVITNEEKNGISYFSKNTIRSIPEPYKYKRRSRQLYESKNSPLGKNFNRSATYIMEKKTNVLKKTFKEVKKLLSNKIYIIITLGMSNLYFVVTGIQFWITEYMSVVLLTEKMKIVTVSTLCFLTSPTSGVWFGGFICDLFGGYKNTNYSKTIKVATAFAISACIFGIMSAHLNNFFFFSVSLWLCLFTGSALVPVAVGMLLSCVNNHQKSLSSAVSQVIYNVFGWFSAPLLSGIIMDIMHKYTNDNRLALKAGFTMILYSSFIGFLLLLYANFLDFSDKKENDDLLELEEPLT